MLKDKMNRSVIIGLFMALIFSWFFVLYLNSLIVGIFIGIAFGLSFSYAEHKKSGEKDKKS